MVFPVSFEHFMTFRRTVLLDLLRWREILKKTGLGLGAGVRLNAYILNKKISTPLLKLWLC